MSATEMQRHEPGRLAQFDVQALLAQAIDKGVNVDTMERLVALAKDMRAVQAKEAFNQAKASFMGRCPPIVKDETAEIRTRSGSKFTYRYAGLAGVEDKVRDLLAELGFSYAWKQRMDGFKVITDCILSHALGHEESSGEIEIPVEQGEGGSGASPAQRVGIASTYGRRYSLLAVLGKHPESDDDGQSQHNGHEAPPPVDEAATIAEADQRRLWATIRKSGWGEDVETAMHDILASFQLGHVREIPTGRLQEIVNVIKLGPKR